MKRNWIQKTLQVGSLFCNCQILVCPETAYAAIVDPGAEPDRILESLRSLENELSRQVQVKALLHTHAHFDHVGATRALKEHFVSVGSSVPSIYLHPGDAQIYANLEKQGQMFGIPHDAPLSVDSWISDNQVLEVGKMKFEIKHTPGHSPGGVCFCLKENSEIRAPEMIFSGDTLFYENIGRADLWGGDENILIKSIRERLMVLDDDIPIWPGHGPKTSVGHEKRNNPYI